MIEVNEEEWREAVRRISKRTMVAEYCANMALSAALSALGIDKVYVILEEENNE